VGDAVGVSVIIPCYLLPDKNKELSGWTLDCVRSFREHCPGVEIVIVDNGSTVDECMLRWLADVYLRNSSNLGYARAANQGMKIANNDWLVVSNNDTLLLDNWISTALGAWEDNTGVVCSHLIDHDPRRNAGRQVLPHEGYFFGALWMTHRDVLDKAGYISEEYELGYYEDKDWCCEVLAAGYELVKVGWCRHIGNATSGKLPQLHQMFARNKEHFENKWKGK